MNKEDFLDAHKLQIKKDNIRDYLNELNTFIEGNNLTGQLKEIHKNGEVNEVFQITIMRTLDEKKFIIDKSKNKEIFDFLKDKSAKCIEQLSNEIDCILEDTHGQF